MLHLASLYAVNFCMCNIRLKARVKLKEEKFAKSMPHLLHYFTVCPQLSIFNLLLLTVLQPATSLGGVESLIEQRAISDPNSDPRLLRISVGVEDVEVISF